MGSGRVALLVAMFGLALAGAWFFLQGGAGRPPDPAPSAGQPEIIQLFNSPENLPAIVMTDLDGRTHSSADWRGKVVLINFWATWCPPCRAEIPDLVELQDKYRDKLVIIGVSEDDPPFAKVQKFADEHGMNYPIVMTTPEIRKTYTGVAALPTTFVIDTEGRLAQRHVGMLNPAVTEAEVRVLAGLPVTAKVERVENNPKARIENAAEAKAIPGIDLTKLDKTQKDAVVQALMAEDCTCGCGLTLAICRLDDPTCPVSLPMAQDIVKKYSATP